MIAFAIFLFIAIAVCGYIMPNFTKHLIVAPMVGCFLGMYAWGLCAMVWNGLISWGWVVLFNIVGIALSEFAAGVMDS